MPREKRVPISEDRWQLYVDHNEKVLDVFVRATSGLFSIPSDGLYAPPLVRSYFYSTAHLHEKLRKVG